MAVFMNDDDLGVSLRPGADVGAGFETSLMARTLAALFAAGATLALLTVALPHSARASNLGLLLIIGNAYIVAALLFWQADRVSVKLLPALLAWGSTLIGG